MSMGSSTSTKGMKSWQRRIFGTVWITYFAFYLCRYNMPMAKTSMCDLYGWSTVEFGLILSALTLAYAVGQFVNGQLADRFGARRIASCGAFGSVTVNVIVFAVLILVPTDALSKGAILWTFAILWGVNGFFQAMGWSPMVRIMAHWYPTSTRGKVMGFLGTCYQLGAATSWFLALFIIKYYAEKMDGDWRMVFLAPSVLFALVGILFAVLIRNAPEDVGLAMEDEDGDEVPLPANTQRTLEQNVLRTLKNPYLWVVAGTFFLLDLNRYGFVNWLPAYLDEQEISMGTSVFGLKAVMKRCIHPLAGGLGAIAAGWATDKFFGGRRAPVIAVLLLILGISSLLFPYLPHDNPGLLIAVLAVIGFCTYGPHILMVGHAAQDFGKKSGAAGAAGFIDGMGYIGASLAGVGAGAVIKEYGYQVNFVIFGIAAILGAALICLLWKVGPNTAH
jgi:sugar phosphate permease